VVFVNILLKKLLLYLVEYERHATANAQAKALCSKLAFSTFINIGVLVLLANGRLPNDAEEENAIVAGLANLGILAGEHRDFTSGWYSTVGVSIIYTLLVDLISRYAPPLFTLLWTRPRLLRSLRRKIDEEGNYPLGEIPCVDGSRLLSMGSGSRREQGESGASRNTSNQRDLNSILLAEDSISLFEQAEGGSHTFHPSIRLPSTLTTVFIAMAYSAGLPLLLPMAGLSMIVSYWLDKVLLLRLFRRPDGFDDETLIMEFATRTLPWALALHCALAAWMYGVDEILASNVLDAQWLAEQTGGSTASLAHSYDLWLKKSSEWDILGIAPKIARKNVMPMVLLLTVLLIGVVAVYILRRLIFDKDSGVRTFSRALTVAGSATVRSAHKKSKKVKPDSAAVHPADTADATNGDNEPPKHSRLKTMRHAVGQSTRTLLKIIDADAKARDFYPPFTAAFSQYSHDKSANSRSQRWLKQVGSANIHNSNRKAGCSDDLHLPAEKSKQGWTLTHTAWGKQLQWLYTKKGARLGQPRHTWEVIRDSGYLFTYDIQMNPKYRDALMARKEAVDTLQ